MNRLAETEPAAAWLALVGLGVALFLLGYSNLVVAAFAREKRPWWGAACLLCLPLVFVYGALRWRNARLRAWFLVALAGVLCAGFAVAMSLPDVLRAL